MDRYYGSVLVDAGEYRASDIGSHVVVMGWVAKYRHLGSLFFADLRDRTGIVQISVHEEGEAMTVAGDIRNEYVVAVEGTVVSRGDNANKNIPTGEVEIVCDRIHILADAEVTPFAISDNVNCNDALRLKYRYLDLRRPAVQKNLIMRDKISNVCTIAGCYVTGGKVTRNCLIRVVRDGIVLAEDKIASLRRFKDDVKEVASGYECGIGLEKFSDVKNGDIFEAFIMEEVKN